MKLVILAMVALMSATSAFSASVEFKFDINSSGPSIYPCNAGLKHEKHNGQVCYDRTDASKSCDRGDCVEGVQCNCVCTGANDSAAGEYRHDFFNASYAQWTDNGDYVGTISTKNVVAKIGGSSLPYNKLFDTAAKADWNQQLTKLTFNLGSERYGAKFFLDVCYRGPQIEYFEASQYGFDGYKPDFFAKAQATITDIANDAYKYSEKANLKVKATLVCDRQGEGNYMYAHNNNYVYDIPTAHEIGSFSALSGSLFRATSGSNYVAFNTAQNRNLIKTWITYNSSKTPRFCKVRYEFSEERRNDSNLLNTIRKWKKHSAQVCTYTSINEDV